MGSEHRDPTWRAPLALSSTTHFLPLICTLVLSLVSIIYHHSSPATSRFLSHEDYFILKDLESNRLWNTKRSLPPVPLCLPTTFSFQITARVEPLVLIRLPVPTAPTHPPVLPLALMPTALPLDSRDDILDSEISVWGSPVVP